MENALYLSDVTIVHISLTTFPTTPRCASCELTQSKEFRSTTAEAFVRRTARVRSCACWRYLRGLWRHDVSSVDEWGQECGARVTGPQGRPYEGRLVWMCGAEAAEPGCERGGECGRSSLEDAGI